MTSFREFAATATNGLDPYPYQRALAQGEWPDALEVPTGLGKTAAVILSWLFKRLALHSETPCRLIYCLPMRVLVEQTHHSASAWVKAAEPLFRSHGLEPPTVHLLMGGETDTTWVPHPECPAIIIGTQDMLLSRALMRGYGMSRFQWPVHFALLHNDALWVFDEVQLMGPALATTTQLEGLRRQLGTTRPCRSLWVSATLRSDWLNTIDFRPYRDNLAVQRLTDADRENRNVARRLTAKKALTSASTQLDSDTVRQKAKPYIASLADEVVSTHRPGTQTLVILNRVDRAQMLHEAIHKTDGSLDLLLLHARFRASEREHIEAALKEAPSSGRIVITTQAVEAGVDITSDSLFTELAPWPSLIQRFGRCNRDGHADGAIVRWIDITPAANAAAPYSDDELTTAREILSGLASASSADLPPVTNAPAHSHVLRRRDLLDLFDTDPDLAGFDVDVAPYIRDTGSPQLQVYWREFEHRPERDMAAPHRAELCPVSITQARDHLSKDRTAFVWDPLVGDWAAVNGGRLRPGMRLLLRCADGGYDQRLGFVPGNRSTVLPAPEKREDENAPEAVDSEPLTAIGCWVDLTTHLTDAAAEAESIGQALGLPSEDVAILIDASRWHDVGKAHAAFQTALAGAAREKPNQEALWAKSDGYSRLVYAMPTSNGQPEPRPHFRHELASMLAWLEHGDRDERRDLIAYLIAAHHGKVRMSLRALPGEASPPDDRLFARGVWANDELPAVRLNGHHIPPTTLRLDLMRLGEGSQGPSWASRTRGLLSEYGPFRLAWLEALVRIADWRASSKRRKPQ